MNDGERQEIIRLAKRIPVLSREAFQYCEELSLTLSLTWLARETLWRVANRLRLPWAARRHSPVSLLCERLGTVTMLARCIVVLADPALDADEYLELLDDET